MHDSGLLILTKHISHLCRGNNISNLVSNVKNIVTNKLYIHLANISNGSPKDDQSLCQNYNVLQQNSSSEIFTFLMKFYSEAAEQCGELDVNVNLHNFKNSNFQTAKLNDSINCILTDIPLQVEQVGSKINFLGSTYELTNKNEKYKLPVVKVDLKYLDEKQNLTKGKEKQLINSQLSVVLGGTFDHIHAGHKIILSEAILLAKQKLLIGVTSKDMLKKKTLKELIKPFEERKTQLVDFIENVSQFTSKSHQNNKLLEVVEINDPIGPAGTDKDLNCIVVSKETEKGGFYVNEARKKLKLQPLIVHTIGQGLLVKKDVMSDKILKESKVSSSTLRYESLGTYRKSSSKLTTSKKDVYLIGVTGGIACGKSSISRQLEQLGAHVVDCDKLGHQAYLPNTSTFNKIVDHFGREVVGDDGNINRKVLGPKVFTDKKELKKLNSIVWPEINRLAMLEVDKAVRMKKSAELPVVCVLDAAVLIEAGWHELTDEVWVSMIPPEEAVRRVVERDSRKVADAESIVASQLTNEERVSHAHVVLSTMWRYEDTRKQIEKAWELLQQRIKSIYKKSTL